FHGRAKNRLALDVQPRRGQGAVIFEEEVSVHIIEELGKSARVTLAVGTKTNNEVFGAVAARQPDRIKGPGDMIVMIAPIWSLFVGALCCRIISSSEIGW